jgi:integrase
MENSVAGRREAAIRQRKRKRGDFVSIYKRGGVYWYKFHWKGALVRESTKQGNDKVARQMEAAHRTSLAKGEVGIRDKKAAPTFADFAEKQFLPWAESTFAAKPKTWTYYRNGVRQLKAYKPLASSALDDNRVGEKVSGYIAHRQAAVMPGGRPKGLQISSINRELQALRRLLNLAVEWGVVEKAPNIKMLPGERHREFVLQHSEEVKYLAASREPLVSVATVLIDTGMRPEECYRLQWEYVSWDNGRHGSMFVTHGKTAAARRTLPMTARVRKLLEERWEVAGKPLQGWVWPAPSKSGHIEPCSLKKQHKKALKLSKVRQFVLYSLRHTFMTRLGASCGDPWKLARIAGWSSIEMSSRYVHPSGDSIIDAMERMTGHSAEGEATGGHKTGHSDEQSQITQEGEKLLTV